MCGIYFCLGGEESAPRSAKHRCLRSRGPDQLNIVETNEYYSAFYRLAIVGVSDGIQPFQAGNVTMLCNGEIYNYADLIKEYNLPVETHSDCECILHMYKKLGIEQTVTLLNGEFAFVLYDADKKLMYFARDRLGRKPLYYSVGEASQREDMRVNNEAFQKGGAMQTEDPRENTANSAILRQKIDVCSLYAGLEHRNKEQVIPRYLYTFDGNTGVLFKQAYHTFVYKQGATTRNDIYRTFCSAVYNRIHQSERPVGFLLSGGFDSSLVLSVALAYGSLAQPPHVFTIGFSEDAPDVKSAELMVAWLKARYGENCIKWHRIIVPIQAGLNAIPKVVRALETYDTTTIRASTPMYLISKYIAENTDVRVILSGEGSDELFGGYLYFNYAPDDQGFRAEIIDRLNELYLYDVLRADRTTAAWGLEIRTPFLDDVFVGTVLECGDLVKCKKYTKELIRQAAADRDILPNEILYGKKEAFSDAVGMSWKESIHLHAEKFISKLRKMNTSVYANHIIPETAEMRYFQYLFKSYFGMDAFDLLPHLWLPNQNWIKTGVEPSARVLPNYSNATNF